MITFYRWFILVIGVMYISYWVEVYSWIFNWLGMFLLLVNCIVVYIISSLMGNLFSDYAKKRYFTKHPLTEKYYKICLRQVEKINEQIDIGK